MILSVAQLEVLLLIIARIAGIFIEAPILSSRSIPSTFKIFFALWLSFVLWFVIPVTDNLPTALPAFLFTLISEVAVGFLIGFVCNLIFIAVQAAGEIMDMQMGLSVASALDPVFGAVISVIGRLTFFVALIIFITLDGHHLILSALQQSFTALPAGRIANFSTFALADQLLGLGSLLWLTAIKIAAPVVLLIFISDFSFGIVSRVAPQVNVFMLGFEVKPVLGLFGISLIMPFFVRYIGRLIETMGAEAVKLLAVIK